MFVVSVLGMMEQASHPHMSLSTRGDRSSQCHNQEATIQGAIAYVNESGMFSN
ncbi:MULTISPECIES: hypothetical protein [Nostoc]|uniref:Uncharacterized protein n=1 Tax=Nostoc paludosum FACHB-159 TaxID=2692908 RepID=A0ABR8KB72_9NOSO|nr:MULTISPECIES: hypothetical protein [Nostoc]MBD2680386.1 hypothetical protein [Nostoc sp. FACHB-857]MBD2736774.1 hypothetical protein [Nostoc paludosum FACHB-159]